MGGVGAVRVVDAVDIGPKVVSVGEVAMESVVKGPHVGVNDPLEAWVDVGGIGEVGSRNRHINASSPPLAASLSRVRPPARVLK